MADSYRPLFEGLKETAAALVQASEANQQANLALQRAGAGITKMADAAMDAREEHEDLRETVARLEHLVIAQGADLRAMRERLDRGGR